MSPNWVIVERHYRQLTLTIAVLTYNQSHYKDSQNITSKMVANPTQIQNTIFTKRFKD